MELYEAIKRRRSIRNYAREGLSEGELDNLEKRLNKNRSFYPETSTSARLVRNGRKLQEDISGILADYGKVEAPHYLVLTCEDSEKGYTELGYRNEFEVLTLAEGDIGSCWIGKGFSEQELKQYVRIPPEQSAGTLLAFGPLPEGEKLYEIQEPKRKDLDHFMVESNPENLDEETLEVIDCLRRAPSALNGQPWRVSVEGKTIHLYLKKRNRVTRMVLKDLWLMNRVDAGIGLCHLEVGGRKLWGEAELDIVEHPKVESLTYVGSLINQGIGKKST